MKLNTSEQKDKRGVELGESILSDENKKWSNRKVMTVTIEFGFGKLPL